MSYNSKRKTSTTEKAVTGGLGCLVLLFVLFLGFLFWAGVTAIIAFILMVIWNALIVPNVPNTVEVPFIVMFGLTAIGRIVGSFFTSSKTVTVNK